MIKMMAMLADHREETHKSRKHSVRGMGLSRGSFFLAFNYEQYFALDAAFWIVFRLVDHFEEN